MTTVLCDFYLRVDFLLLVFTHKVRDNFSCICVSERNRPISVVETDLPVKAWVAATLEPNRFEVDWSCTNRVLKVDLLVLEHV